MDCTLCEILAQRGRILPDFVHVCFMNMEEESIFYLFITANISIISSMQFRALSSSLLGCFIAILISACRNHLP